MGNRKQQSNLEVWTDLSSRLPWWLALLLALLSYLLLHFYAGRTEPPPTQLGGFGSYAGRQLYRGIALYLQYLIPAVLIIGAIVSAVRRAQQRKRFDETRSRGTRSALLDMSWQEFEGLVAEHFRRQGYVVTEAGGSAPDGGIDLQLIKGGEHFLVQCKQWRAYKVGVDVVRQLYGVMAARGAVGEFVVTSGEFTDDARSFSSGRNILLVDGERLIAMMRTGVSPIATSSHPRSAAPVCPKCSGAMVRRIARHGPRVGQAFWGCSQYPKCTGTRAASS